MRDATDNIECSIDLADDDYLSKEERESLINLKPVVIEGDWNSRQVKIDGKELYPAYSQSIRNHSPDGFAWGYGGSGPTQLALAILLHLTKNIKCGTRLSRRLYQQFKWDHVSRWPQGNVRVTIEDIGEWFKTSII